MASRRPRLGALGRHGEHPHTWAALAAARAFHASPAANDNKAPLRLKMRRRVLVTMAALAVAWLFWVGLLR